MQEIKSRRSIRKYKKEAIDRNDMRCPLKVRLLRDDFGRLVFLYAVKRWSRYWTGLLHPNFSFIRFSL